MKRAPLRCLLPAQLLLLSLLMPALMLPPFSSSPVPPGDGCLRGESILSGAEASEITGTGRSSNHRESQTGRQSWRLAALETRTNPYHPEGEEPFFETEYYLQSWRNPTALRGILLQILLLGVANLVLYVLARRRRERR